MTFDRNEILGMTRVASCVPVVRPGATEDNCRAIAKIAEDAVEKGALIILFPELCVTGYSCGDLFHDQLLIQSTIENIRKLAESTSGMKALLVVGAPIRFRDNLYNCAVAMSGGKIVGIVPKYFLPNYNEFYEQRWFASAFDVPANSVVNIGEDEVRFGGDIIFDVEGTKVGIEICEDLWVPEPPSGRLATAGAEIVLNLSASDEVIGKNAYLLDLIKNQSARCRCGYVYASAGAGESSTDLAFPGKAIIVEDGSILARAPRFEMDSKMVIADIDVAHIRHDRMHSTTFTSPLPSSFRPDIIHVDIKGYKNLTPLKYRVINPFPFVPSDERHLRERCAEISSIQSWGLATRLKAINCKDVVVGISGGLDSTLALLVTVKAFDMLGLDRKGIHGITMPGFGTTGRTKNNATLLMEELGIDSMEIPIGEAVKLHLANIGHDGKTTDITYENSQARERTQILMDLANKYNGMVIGTGDMSELALGWCTYNGDQMSMYGVNASIPKTLVKYLVRGYAYESTSKRMHDILMDIIDTPISPELLPADDKGNIKQLTEDNVGPYELHDFFMYHMLRYGSDPLKILLLADAAFGNKYERPIILKWLKTFYRRFFSQQFKRSCMPDGVKVGSICLSPRGDWRMPSDASSKLWLNRLSEADNI